MVVRVRMRVKPHSETPWQVAELIFFFGLAPVLVGKFVSSFAWIPVLWITALGAYWHGRLRHERIPAEESRHRIAAGRQRLIARFLISSAIITAATAYGMPGLLLNFPRHRPYLWAAVMILYPVLSVWPQEYLYRAYFFRRFRGLFPNEKILTAASAIAFSWAHIIFRNPYALVLTLGGGFFFADTYRRSRSLRLVSWEHACYGWLIFTVGLGEFFY